MEKKTWIIIILVGVIIALTSFFLNRITTLNKDHEIETDVLRKISGTQYRKVVADSLTKREMKKLIDSLEIEAIKNPKIVTIVDVQVKEGKKTVDTLYLPTENKKLYVSDYYPNKEKPFVNYTLNDTIGRFKFYPFQMSLVILETEAGNWVVDTKVPEYFEITDIKAVARPKPTIQKTTPFYIGGKVQKQNEEYPISVLGGFRIKRVIIFGGVNTKGQAEIGTLYNL